MSISIAVAFAAERYAPPFPRPPSAVFSLFLVVLLHVNHLVGRWREQFALAPLGLYRVNCALREAMSLTLQTRQE